MDKDALYNEAFALLDRINTLLDRAFANIHKRLATIGVMRHECRKS